MDKKIKLVTAGSKTQFIIWCTRHKLNPDDYKYISKAKDIYGHKDCVIFRIGHYYSNPDLCEINAYCVLHNIKTVYMYEGKEEGEIK